MRIYTKTGDGGQTALFGGQRVSKHALRVETFGTVDELNAVLGQVRATADHGHLEGLLVDLQALLFSVGALLATPPGVRHPPPPLPADCVVNLESHIDLFEAELSPLKSFILPAGTAQSAALHTARAVCRRAERLCVHLHELEPDTDAGLLVVLNRLSDLLFVMARIANSRASVPDSLWHAPKNNA